MHSLGSLAWRVGTSIFTAVQSLIPWQLCGLPFHLDQFPIVPKLRHTLHFAIPPCCAATTFRISQSPTSTSMGLPGLIHGLLHLDGAFVHTNRWQAWAHGHSAEIVQE